MKTLQDELVKHFKPILPGPKQVQENKNKIRDILSRNNLEAYPEYVFTFGKYKGSYLEDVAKENSSYLKWLLTQDFICENLSLHAKIKKTLEMLEDENRNRSN